MEGLIILIAIIAMGIAGYIFFTSSRDAKVKKQQETEMSELKQQVISLNVKLQKLEFEHTTLSKDAEDAKIALEDTKNELETLRKKEFSLSEEAARLKELERKQEETIGLLKAENITLKEKIISKENETRKLVQEIKALKEKIAQIQASDEPLMPRPDRENKQPEQPPADTAT
jgi:chromosome segregation ATPase